MKTFGRNKHSDSTLVSFSGWIMFLKIGVCGDFSLGWESLHLTAQFGDSLSQCSSSAVLSVSLCCVNLFLVIFWSHQPCGKYVEEIYNLQSRRKVMIPFHFWMSRSQKRSMIISKRLFYISQPAQIAFLISHRITLNVKRDVQLFMHRATLIPSTEHEKLKEVGEVTKALEENGFPNNFIHSVTTLAN